ncbi:MAG TPA: translation initiation factor IF-2 [Longimicrobiaceae bacterium]|nr:translation initiation factor IF-2 [Longimicrobiaceae bacterium]
MRVYEVAKELNVPSEALVHLLREMDVPVRSHMTLLADEHVARLRTVLERERRLGHNTATEAIEAAIGDAGNAPRRRRRRRADTDEVETEEQEAAEPDTVVPLPESSASPAADAAEAMAAEAADLAAERGADLVTTGSQPPRNETVIVESPPVEPAAAPEAVERPQPPTRAQTPAAPPRHPSAPTPSRPAAPAPGRPRPAPAHPPRPAREEPGQHARPAARGGAGEAPPRPPRPFEVGGAPMPARRGGPPPVPARRGEQPARAGVQAEGAGAAASKRRKKDRKKRRGVDQEAVEEMFKKTMAAMESSGGGRRRGRRRDHGPTAQERREEEQERIRQEEATTVRVNEFLTVAELAELIDVSPTQIISSAFKNLGLMVTINQRLDFDQIELLLDEFGLQAVREAEYGADMEETEVEDAAEDLQPRPPVVTVMGHVDHGKTSLLDYIRKTNVIAGEAGGITQHIGAYHVALDDGRALTFLDTPGHAAFTAMRARGAEVTDLVILVVAADDSVMPQTIEAISHAKNAGVPLVVAVNKVDLPDANPMRVKQDLLQHGVVLEEFGGDVMSADVSAKKGTGIDDLLERVLLQADVLELQANPDREAHGAVIEAQLDVGKGPVATVLVTNGTLRVGDSVVCGLYSGRIRAMLDERGRPVQEAGPSTPVQILGLPGVPAAGDQLVAMEADRAHDIAQTRQRLEREKRMRIRSRGVKLTDFSKMLEKGEAQHLALVIKGDVDGSVQALSDSLEQLSTPEVEVQVIHRAVGAINESDVLLASTAGAIVVGFHVRPTAEARTVAEREDVDIRLYNIIYEAVEEVRAAMEGMLSPEEREVMLGTAEVRQIFKVPRVGTVAGCMVTSGELQRRGKIRVIRDSVQIYEGELGSLKRFKDDVREVREGFECGLNVSNFNDVKVGDVIECYRVEEVARSLSGAGEQ